MGQTNETASQFDRIYDRAHTRDLKWRSEGIASYLDGKVPENMIPMWIADTDFGCMKGIVDAIKKRAEFGLYGYCGPDKSFYDAIAFWEQARFQWEIQQSWISVLPTVVSGINIAIRAFTEKGDGVIIQTPVYDPFISIVKRAERTPVFNCLIQENGEYRMNFEELEALAAKPENRMLILCSPHNPVGRVWKEEELRRMADICLKHNVLVVTDEIHSDIVYGTHRHYPLLSLDQRYAENFIHLSAPGKTFNVPGLKISFSIIPNAEIKQKFDKQLLAMSLDVRNTFGIECVPACYNEEGIQWLSELLSYLNENISFVESFLKENMPKVGFRRPEGTFLCWLDFSAYGISDGEILKHVNFEAGVICVPGGWFGTGGEQHLRLNVGCPRSILKEALERIARAF